MRRLLRRWSVRDSRPLGLFIRLRARSSATYVISGRFPRSSSTKISTTRLNGKMAPTRCKAALAKLGVGQDTIFTWLKTGRLKGEHLGRSMPWKIYVTEDDERQLHEWLRCQGRRTRQSKREAL